MGQFACIHFNQHNILISKKEIASITPVTYLGYQGYQVQIPISLQEMTHKQWIKLEKQFNDYDIEYLSTKEQIDYEFENTRIVQGDQLKPYFSKLIMDYVTKYELAHTNPLFMKVGIIGGNLTQMMGVISSIVDDLSDLTLFSDTPYIYKELIGEIYKETRLKVRCSVPCSQTLKSMHIVFDCMGRKNYAKWCDPKAIYIDLNEYFSTRNTLFHSYPPIIWYDFDIVCEGQLIPVDYLQGILLAQGISKRLTALTLKRMGVKIVRPYTVGIS